MIHPKKFKHINFEDLKPVREVSKKQGKSEGLNLKNIRNDLIKFKK